MQEGNLIPLVRIFSSGSRNGIQNSTELRQLRAFILIREWNSLVIVQITHTVAKYNSLYHDVLILQVQLKTISNKQFSFELNKQKITNFLTDELFFTFLLTRSIL